MNATIFALGIYKGSGGVTKSVSAFQRALDASVVSWVDPVQMEEQPLVLRNSTLVRGSRLPLLRNVLFPALGEVKEADAVIAKSGLVSCHSFWRWHCLWLRHTARQHRVPYWFVPHGSLDPYVFSNGRFAKRLFMFGGGRRFIREAACVIFSTRREKEKATPVCPARRSEVIYWPLSDQDFARSRKQGAGLAVREEHGIPPNHRCLLYLGRLDRMKRPLETIDALATSGRDDVHLLIVGNEFGVSILDCRRRAERLGIGGRVHVVGPVYGDALAAYFSAADAYISLSSRENFNFTAAESMAVGLPVILSPGNDLTGELEGVPCGMLLKEDGLETAAQAIRAFADYPEPVLSDMGMEGAKWSRRELSFAVFEKRVRNLASTIALEFRAGIDSCSNVA